MADDTKTGPQQEEGARRRLRDFLVSHWILILTTTSGVSGALSLFPRPWKLAGWSGVAWCAYVANDIDRFLGRATP